MRLEGKFRPKEVEECDSPLWTKQKDTYHVRVVNPDAPASAGEKTYEVSVYRHLPKVEFFYPESLTTEEFTIQEAMEDGDTVRFKMSGPAVPTPTMSCSGHELGGGWSSTSNTINLTTTVYSYPVAYMTIDQKTGEFGFTR